MTLSAIFLRGFKLVGNFVYRLIDLIYIFLDRKCVLRTKNICLIPGAKNRTGGKYSYAEWAQVIGIFQTLIYLNLNKKEDNRLLDVGCGTGILGIASAPYLGENGSYTGIDVGKKEIAFCRTHYPSNRFHFISLDLNNAAYAPDQKKTRKKWMLDSNSFDLVTALSVWIHLNQEDAAFFLKEVSRVLKPGAKAIITFFLLDELYQQSLSLRTKAKGRFHMTLQDEWIFDQPAYDSDICFCPKWAEIPELAVGMTIEGLHRILLSTDLQLIDFYPGNWKEIPGLYFQDVLIFQKSLTAVN